MFAYLSIYRILNLSNACISAYYMYIYSTVKQTSAVLIKNYDRCTNDFLC